jgi:putative ABC transport system substrate-binding protein
MRMPSCLLAASSRAAEEAPATKIADDRRSGMNADARNTQRNALSMTACAERLGVLVKSRSGFAANLAHPGGNITGFTVDDSALGSKWVELLKEIAPRTAHMQLLFHPAGPPLQFFLPSIQAAALSLKVQVSSATVHAKDEIEGVIAAQGRDLVRGLIVMPNAFNTTNRELIIALAARYGVAAIYFSAFCAQSGGLIAYGTDYAEQSRQAAGYVDRILKGTKPADLPVQAPTKFELVINLKTAKTLGLPVPDKLLALADEVIE